MHTFVRILVVFLIEALLLKIFFPEQTANIVSLAGTTLVVSWLIPLVLMLAIMAFVYGGARCNLIPAASVDSITHRIKRWKKDYPARTWVVLFMAFAVLITPFTTVYLQWMYGTGQAPVWQAFLLYALGSLIVKRAAAAAQPCAA